MQFGVGNERAAQKVRDAGLLFVMDRCMMLDTAASTLWRTKEPWWT
jgi:predicted CoA-binding protein